jgi:hypothetical protein
MSSEIKPRDIPSNPRCPVCKAEDPRSGHPMYHPAHPWGPCRVRLLDGTECGCRETSVDEIEEAL